MGRFEYARKICARWKRRYRRKGFGRPLGKQLAHNVIEANEANEAPEATTARPTAPRLQR
jgi:hypothetical protein